jgi:hypothetical protein
MKADVTRRWCFYCVVTLLALSVLSPGQDTAAASSPSASEACPAGDSLGAIACRSKKQKVTHAKRSFNDDDVQRSAGPLPALRMDVADSGDQVVAAVADYNKTHTPEETEHAVRLWYDKYDQQLEAAIGDNIDRQSLRQANMASGYDLCQESRDYSYCQKRQMAEMREERRDQVTISANNNVSLRIQHAFMNVRNGLSRNGLHYDWFKIRTTNNVDKF